MQTDSRGVKILEGSDVISEEPLNDNFRKLSDNVGATSTASSRIDQLSRDFSKTVPISKGGTGATSAASALANLGVTISKNPPPSTGTPGTIYIQIL